jgi:hypothetical protein
MLGLVRQEMILQFSGEDRIRAAELAASNEAALEDAVSGEQRDNNDVTGAISVAAFTTDKVSWQQSSGVLTFVPMCRGGKPQR